MELFCSHRQSLAHFQRYGIIFGILFQGTLYITLEDIWNMLTAYVHMKTMRRM